MSTTTAKNSTTSDINSAGVAALAKAISTKELDAARLDLPEGSEIEIDLLIQVSGILKIGNSAETTQVATLKPWRLFLAALGMLNGVSIGAIIKAADDLSDLDEKANKLRVMEAAEALKGRVRITRAAPLKFIGTVEGIE